MFPLGPPESSEDDASGDEGLPDDDNSDVSTTPSFQCCTWVVLFLFLSCLILWPLPFSLQNWEEEDEEDDGAMEGQNSGDEDGRLESKTNGDEDMEHENESEEE